jgi:hypothetical protein
MGRTAKYIEDTRDEREKEAHTSKIQTQLMCVYPVREDVVAEAIRAVYNREYRMFLHGPVIDDTVFHIIVRSTPPNRQTLAIYIEIAQPDGKAAYLWITDDVVTIDAYQLLILEHVMDKRQSLKCVDTFRMIHVNPVEMLEICNG